MCSAQKGQIVTAFYTLKVDRNNEKCALLFARDKNLIYRQHLAKHTRSEYKHFAKFARAFIVLFVMHTASCVTFAYLL